MTNVNFLPAERRIRSIRRRALSRWTVAAIVWTTLLAGAGIAAPHLSPSSDLDGVERSIATLEGESARLVESIARLERDVASTTRSVAAARATVDHPDWSRLLIRIVAERPESMAFRSWRLVRSGASSTKDALHLEIDGDAADLESLTAFVVAIEKLGVFERVRMVRAEKKSTPDGSVVDFALSGELLRGGRR
jgi:hypothetical protein